MATFFNALGPTLLALGAGMQAKFAADRSRGRHRDPKKGWERWKITLGWGLILTGSLFVAAAPVWTAIRAASATA
ncbi:hypothetical protein [Terrabacter sp. NPDC000476]|uniref:hypothetical protein n=1 Tax=Terrabacter sp. NPDC000476 TaxID=3154258 RepID=UPI0033171DCE